MNETIHIQDTNKKYKVRVNCMTFNQASYITDALDGFVMQQTDFPFVCVIVDDASTDGEPEVIKKYLEERFDKEVLDIQSPDETDEYIRVFARHKENRNCYFLVLFLKYNHYSIKKPKLRSMAELINIIPYIALCEGDDYWTDPLKLQKQVGFMETHEEYSMCFHGAKLLNECSSVVTSSFHTVREGDYGPNDIFPLWVVPTASVVIRREMISDYPIRHADWFLYGDIVLFEKCAHVGKLFGMNEEMSVYRMNENSLLQNPNNRNNQIMRMPLHFKALRMNFPKLDKTVLNQLIADSYYAKMRNDGSILMKIADFLHFISASPVYSIKKLYNKFNKKD